MSFLGHILAKLLFDALFDEAMSAAEKAAKRSDNNLDDAVVSKFKENKAVIKSALGKVL